MKLISSKNLLASLTFFFFLGGATNSVTAASFFDDFENGLNPETSAVRSFVDREENPDEIFEPAIQDNNGNQVLLLSDENAPADDGPVTISFLNFVETFENVLVSALFNATGDTDNQGLLNARIDFSSASAYTAGIDFGTNRVSLTKVVDAEIVDSFTVEEFDVLDSLNSAYFVELEVVGNEVTARFFNETRTELITELSATDANPLGSGFIGLGVGNSDADPDLLNNLSATFDNFGAQHVPEPSTLLALLGFGTLAGKTLRRK